MNTVLAPTPLRIAIFGLSITSSWGNGHATTWRALARALASRGHSISFYERDRPWYAENRDLTRADYCDIVLYDSLTALDAYLEDSIKADLILIGSYVPDGIRVAQWVLERSLGITAFYDLDTPVTVAQLAADQCSFLSRALVPAFDAYLSFAGGPILKRLQNEYGACRARPLYCSVDCEEYFPEAATRRFDLGYLGTYSDDRQPMLEKLMLEPARAYKPGKFCVAGSQYPDSIEWPKNVARIDHLPPSQHRRFYNEQRFTLNVTRADMVSNGWSPSVRLFEAAACGVPIITDLWNGLEDFFTPGEEILVAQSARDVSRYLKELSPEETHAIGAKARARVLRQHSSEHRAEELEAVVAEIRGAMRAPGSRAATSPGIDQVLQ